MTASAHALVGAAIGAIVGDVAHAVAYGLLSHYVIDLLPHIDYIDYHRPGAVERKNRYIWKLSKKEAIGVGLEGIFLIALFVFIFLSPPGVRLAMAWGSVAAMLPDIALIFQKKKGFGWPAKIHNLFQFRRSYRDQWQTRRAILMCVGVEVTVALVALKIVL